MEAANADSEIDFDHTASDVIQDPYPTYRRLRDDAPVARGSRFGGFWALTRYEDVTKAAQDHLTFSNASGISVPNMGSPLPMVPIETDPPVHTRYRRLLQPLFAPGRVALMEADLRRITTDVIDGFIDRGAADLAQELASPLPTMALAHVLGFPESDWPLFRSVTERILETAKREELEANFESAVELCNYLLDHIEDRRLAPRDDLISELVRLELDGEPLTDDELLGMTVLLVVAGHESTVSGIGSMLLNIAATPGAKDRLLADRDLVPPAVEEALRFDAPVKGIARTMTQDVGLHGQALQAGDKVLLLWASANRDEREFPNPDSFVVDRLPNHHVAFGFGIHHCLGAHMARLEMRVVLEEVLRRLPSFRVEDWEGVCYDGWGQSRTVVRLPAVWDHPDQKST